MTMRVAALILLTVIACTERAPEPIYTPGDYAGGDPGNATPPVIAVDLPTEPCPGFVPCGGDLAGTWHLTGACVEQDDLLAELFAWCPGTQLDGFTEQVAQGLFEFGATSVYRQMVAAITVNVRVPVSCAGCACDDLEWELTEDEVTATCESECNASSECVCALRTRLVVSDQFGYQALGTTITTQDGSTFDYCVDGDTLTYVETSIPATEPGVYTLTRQ